MIAMHFLFGRVIVQMLRVSLLQQKMPTICHCALRLINQNGMAFWLMLMSYSRDWWIIVNSMESLKNISLMLLHRHEPHNFWGNHPFIVNVRMRLVFDDQSSAKRVIEIPSQRPFPGSCILSWQRFRISTSSCWVLNRVSVPILLLALWLCHFVWSKFKLLFFIFREHLTHSVFVQIELSSKPSSLVFQSILGC